MYRYFLIFAIYLLIFIVRVKLIVDEDYGCEKKYSQTYVDKNLSVVM